jgi:predicted negative regulator of RcsB-dependent stress response
MKWCWLASHVVFYLFCCCCRRFQKNVVVVVVVVVVVSVGYVVWRNKRSSTFEKNTIAYLHSI